MYRIGLVVSHFSVSSLSWLEFSIALAALLMAIVVFSVNLKR
ncbi:hypothetical protein [Shimazuella kribbensis]|nr:hypothetical protein [Shimazuella kribbensis]